MDGHPLEPLTVALDKPFEATFVSRASPALGRADADLVVFRHRSIGGGMRERVVVRSYGIDPRPVVVELLCDADFAGLFAVKEGRVEPRERYHCTVGRRSLAFAGNASGQRTEIEFSAAALMEPGVATWRFTLDPRSERELCVEVGVQLGGHDVLRRFRRGVDDDESPEQRLASWRGAVPTVESDSVALTSAVARARDDLGALRIFDPDHPELPVIAAGAPWFMTLFGRDSLHHRVDEPDRRAEPRARCARDAGPVPGRPTSTRRPKRSPARSSTRSASAPTPGCPWAAATSTTGRSTPRRCS